MMSNGDRDGHGLCHISEIIDDLIAELEQWSHEMHPDGQSASSRESETRADEFNKGDEDNE